jgi:membrane protein
MLRTVAKEAAGNRSSHKDSRQGAALAYYSVFFLDPIIVIAIAVAGFFFGRKAVSGQVAASIEDMLGDTGAKAIQAMLVDAGRPPRGSDRDFAWTRRSSVRSHWCSCSA